jgi:hypothetical protein
VLELLTGQREIAQAEATRLRNQIHALLLHLDPEYKAHLPTINSRLVYKPCRATPRLPRVRFSSNVRSSCVASPADSH